MKNLRWTVPIFILLFILISCARAGDLDDPSFLAKQATGSAFMMTKKEQPAQVRGEPYSPDETVAILDSLISFDAEESSLALENIRSRNDPVYIAVLVELMRAAQIGLVEPSGFTDYVVVLEQLSGESFGGDWPAWIEWYGATDLKPPPGFTSWKGKLLGRIDPGFSHFLRDDVPSDIRVEEIMWGGVVVDGIPALDNPVMLSAQDADYLLPTEPVFGLSINGDARAYPLRILDWHEMANDVIGDVPVSLAYCTLCGAAIAYDGRAYNGDTYTFGSSGFLFRSNKLMYDRQTRTLWNQLTGEPVLGELVDENIQLNILPVVLTTWEAWEALHPDTKVVDLETGFERTYIPGAAYGDYFSAEDTMFPVWQRSELLEAKDQIYALRIEGSSKAYPLDVLMEEQVINDSIEGTNVVLIAQRDPVTVEGQNTRVGTVTYTAGAEVRAYARGDEIFAAGTNANSVADSDNQVWLISEDALLGPDGQSLERLGGHQAYWFGWYAFFPNTLVYGRD